MNSRQEWVLRVVGLVVALASVMYGVDRDKVLWAVAFPGLVVGGLAFLGLRDRGGSAPVGLATQLERLVRMRELGTLSDAEFELAKSKLLRGGDVPNADGASTR